MTLKCHHKSGENFSVTIKRDSVTISSYEVNVIRIGLEAWADTVAILVLPKYPLFTPPPER